MHILDDLNWRGLIKDYSNEGELRELLSTPQTIYCGFDPSAVSMHIGNFVMISILMRLQQAGHRVIGVVGGATGMIGDPSGKSKERNLLDDATLFHNTEGIRKQLGRFIDLTNPEKGLLVNNYDWLGKMGYLQFLRDFGKYFSINYMLAKDVVASRMESGISYTEFSYMLLQSVDFLTLHRQYGCNIQIGGSDQWGNLTAGLELIRKLEGAEAKAGVMTAHLITKSDGSKFGKSEDGALFLDANLTSPYKLYQYFINVSDEDAIRYLKVFTFLSHEDINIIIKDHLEKPGARIGQKALAKEIVKTVHSESDAEEAVEMSEVLFSGEFTKLKPKQIEELFGNLVVEIHDTPMLEDLLLTIKAASSKREAREFIKNRSISINGEVITDANKVIDKNGALYQQYSILRRGKKNYYLIKHI